MLISSRVPWPRRTFGPGADLALDVDPARPATSAASASQDDAADAGGDPQSQSTASASGGMCFGSAAPLCAARL